MAAALYDGMLVFALWMLLTGFVVALRGNQGIPPGTWWYDLLLLFAGTLFFGWFWTHGGQTLGMQAWRLRLIHRDGHTQIGWRRAVLRYVLAWPCWLLAGLGILWSLADSSGLALHDRLSDTRLVQDPKPKPARKKASE